MTTPTRTTQQVSVEQASLQKRRVALVTQESAEVSPLVELNRKKLVENGTHTPSPITEEDEHRPPSISGMMNSFLEIDEKLENRDQIGTESASIEEEGLDRIIRSTWKLERLLWFGVALCFDQVLNCFITVPLRIIFRVFSSKLIWSEQFMFDVACFSILLLSLAFLTSFVGAAQVYHSIRLQTFMKLYVVVNIAEVLDRLLASLGLDLFDILADASARRRVDGSFVVRYILCLMYTCLHAILFYVRLLTLSVAVNSSNDALFTILVSNNFVELKGSVFKRSTEQNLFQISCSDIVERFVLIVFLFLVGLNEFEARNLASSTDRTDFFTVMVLVLSVEVVVDWIKHMFIVRFNSDINIKDVYDRFLSVLAEDYRGKHMEDIGSLRMKNTFPQVARRLGLPILPIATVIIRVFVFDVSDVLRERSWVFVAGGWAACLMLKICTKFTLTQWAITLGDNLITMLAAEEERSTPLARAATPPVTPRSSNLTFSSMTISAEKQPFVTPKDKETLLGGNESAASKGTKTSGKKTPHKVFSKVNRFDNG